MSVKSAVSAYMSPHPLTVAAMAPLSEARAALVDNRFTILPAVDPEGRCLGVVTASDLIRADAEHHDEVPVAAVMTAPVVHVPPECLISEAAALLSGIGIHHAMVLDQHRHVVGVLSTVDIARALCDTDITQPLRWAMTEELTTLDAGTSCGAARAELQESGYSAAPVTDGVRAIGVVTQMSLLQAEVDHDPDVRIDQIMDSSPHTLPEEATVLDAARLFASRETRRIFVRDAEGGLVGMVTTTDLTRFAATLFDPEDVEV